MKQHIRDEKSIPVEELDGFLTTSDIFSLSTSNHYCLDASAELRHALNMAFRVTADTPAGLGVSLSSVMRQMDNSINKLIAHMGGLERVKSTPLPIIYVTHLRTYLFLYLISLPYTYGHQWEWATIPIVAILSFALLGIDGAASEVSNEKLLRNILC